MGSAFSTRQSSPPTCIVVESSWNVSGSCSTGIADVANGLPEAASTSVSAMVFSPCLFCPNPKGK